MESVKAVTAAATVDGSQRKGPWWSGDPSVSPRCGAKTRAGGKCRAPAMWSKKTQRYTRCRMHGGASNGAAERRRPRSMSARSVEARAALNRSDSRASGVSCRSTPAIAGDETA
jgi:hypothetical protein